MGIGYHVLNPVDEVNKGNWYKKDSNGNPIRIEYYTGLVVAEYERNGYDDSDFYAVIYDPIADNFFSQEYATTRGWTYHCFCKVDACREYRERYKEHLRQCDIYRENMRIQALREPFERLNLPSNWVDTLSNLSKVDKAICLQLLQTKKFKSSFRESVKTQLVNWLDTPDNEKRFSSPFSEKQRDRLSMSLHYRDLH